MDQNLQSIPVLEVAGSHLSTLAMGAELNLQLALALAVELSRRLIRAQAIVQVHRFVILRWDQRIQPTARLP